MKKFAFAVIGAVAIVAFTGCTKNVKAPTANATVAEQTSKTEVAKAAPKEVAETDVIHMPIQFDYNSSTLSDAARAELASLAKTMKRSDAVSLTIEGHCDERGSTEFNLALGERRASATRDYLTRMGVASDRVEIISYGEERPRVASADEDAFRQNRRAEFVLSNN